MEARLERETQPFALSTRTISYVGLVLLNVMLNLVTLTLYRFWGKTAIRRRLWAETQLLGESFEYTGKGSELFKGFLVAAVEVFLPIVLAYGAAQAFLPPAQAASAFAALYLIIGFLAYAAVYLTRRYQLSRTLWRGIRFGLDGSPFAFALFSYGQLMLIVLTLGWWAPAAQQRMARRIWRETRYGDTRFTFGVDAGEALAGPTYKRFAIGWLLAAFGWIAAVAAIVAMAAPHLGDLRGGDADPRRMAMLGGGVLAAVFAWLILASLAFLAYQVAAMRRTAALVGFGEARFALNARTLGVLWLGVSNLLLIVFSLGVLLPLTEIRVWRYIVKRLAVEGALSLEHVRQSEERGPRIGEGLADGLDFGGV
ncbi:MAG: YjgN family protein [Hyphomonadaceae bacterium]